MIYSDSDYIQVMEPLYEQAYRGPEHRFRTLRASLHTLKQEDGSSYLQVTPETLDSLLSHHKVWDVPLYNIHSLKAIRGYLEQGRRVYQYRICIVPETIDVEGEPWYYIGKIADERGVSHRSVIDQCKQDLVTWESMRLPSGISKRRYVKRDEKLDYWLSGSGLAPLWEAKKKIYAEWLREGGNKSLVSYVKEYEQDRILAMRGPGSQVSEEDLIFQMSGLTNLSKQAIHALLYDSQREDPNDVDHQSSDQST